MQIVSSSMQNRHAIIAFKHANLVHKHAIQQSNAKRMNMQILKYRQYLILHDRIMFATLFVTRDFGRFRQFDSSKRRSSVCITITTSFLSLRQDKYRLELFLAQL